MTEPGHPAESAAEKVTLTPVPFAVVGVPVIAPVDVFNVSPAGKEPARIPYVYGPVPLLAVIVCE
jgi:hypothetical protein